MRLGERSLRVIGVAADTKYRVLTEAAMPHVYVAASQDYQPRMTRHLRTSADPASVLPPLRSELQRLDPGLVLSDVQSLRAHLGVATLVPRLSASLLGSFGALALIVAGVGVYSVVLLVVAARTPELAVRLAMGATSGAIQGLVIRQSLKLAAWGILVGLLLAAVLGRFIASLLVGVSPFDPTALGSVALLVGAIVVAASLAPAYRASRLEVVRALRS